jgi:hypothetical protein
MVLRTGDKVLIAHRRLFADDQPRFFVGIVESYEQGVARVKGYSWSIDKVRGNMIMKEDSRTKIIAIASGTLIVYQLPEEIDLAKIEIQHDHSNATTLRAGGDFEMDLTDRL